MAKAPQPLAGTRVLELGSFITAPLAAMLLADLGAEIIKVERPGTGDPFRSFNGGLYSPYFRAYNRSKKSIVLDLTKPESRQVVEQLAAHADVLLENFRPGYMDEFGLGYDALTKLNPRLVYCSITGYGPDGPYGDRPSYDTVGQAISGLLSLYVDESDPRLAGIAISDFLTGLYACYAVLGGLMQRERTDRGVRVETNQLAATMAALESYFIAHSLSGELPGIYAKSAVNQSFVLVCADRKLLVVHLSSPPKFWAGLVAATASPELAGDARFAQRPSRIKNYEALREELGTIFARHPRAFWLARLEENDVPFSALNSLEETAQDPQVQHLNLFRDLTHPKEGTTRMLGRPVWYDGDDGRSAAFAPPQLGEHTAEILAALSLRTPSERDVRPPS